MEHRPSVNDVDDVEDFSSDGEGGGSPRAGPRRDVYDVDDDDDDDHGDNDGEEEEEEEEDDYDYKGQVG